MVKKVLLGDMLVNAGVITQEQLDNVLEEQRSSGERLGRILISQGIVDEKTILKTLSEQLDVPLLDLSTVDIDPVFVKKLPEAYARRYRAIILGEEDGEYILGMSDPLDIIALDEVEGLLDKPVKRAVVSEKDLLRALDLNYRRTEEITGFAQELDDEVGDDVIDELEQEAGEVDAPVIKLLRSIFRDAVQVGASDIHIEPGEKTLRVRLRVDGVLNEQEIKEKEVAAAIASRLKVMAKLNISEKRLPQDGRFTIKMEGKVIDVRLSTLPTPQGESVVMRLLEQTGEFLDLNKIGMSPEMLNRLRALARYPYGILLVTGPTGSGKTTTLYGVLNELNEESKKIITAEDPVEYRMDRVVQVQVNEKIEFTYASILRAAMRQDPDIILVGEMRDHETAEMAIRASLTGHMVLSTLHTNNAASTAFRVIDMGVDGYLLAATLRGVLAQRLLRKTCESCVEQADLNDTEKQWLEAVGYKELLETQFYRGKGCNDCNKTGYRGRTGVFELLEIDTSMVEALRKNDVDGFSDLANRALTGALLLDRGVELAKSGKTTIEEVIRVAGER